MNSLTNVNKVLHDFNSNIGAIFVGLSALESRLRNNDYEGSIEILSLIFEKREEVGEDLKKLILLSKKTNS